MSLLKYQICPKGTEKKTILELQEKEEADALAEHTRWNNKVARGEIGVTTIQLSSGMHRILKMLRDMPAADSGLITAGDILTHTGT